MFCPFRFDNKEVLGDRITISWFKDLRRARAQGRYRGKRGSNYHLQCCIMVRFLFTLDLLVLDYVSYKHHPLLTNATSGFQ